MPLRIPAAVEVKSTAIMHEPEAATGLEVEQVVLGSSAKSPLAVRVVIVSGLLPVFVNVTDCAAEVAPATVLPNVRLDGFNETPGALPLPPRVMFCVSPPALSLIVTAPVREPVAVGENVTAIVHVPEAASGVEIEQVVPDRAQNHHWRKGGYGKRAGAGVGQRHRLRRRCCSYHRAAEAQARRSQHNAGRCAGAVSAMVWRRRWRCP